MKSPRTPARPEVAARLRRWYGRRKRSLPWRESDDPYRIWISEIMLQQTQVQTVIPYYQRFVSRFPTAQALASAPVDEVIALWAGLGYYSRGRNLHRAAQRIAAEHGGRFPRDPSAIRDLPGIGEYTTHAIASIAFGEPLAVIDGNVERVLSRLVGLAGDPRRGDGKRNLRAVADEILDRRDPGTHNQALMELGATVCRPRQPRCHRCPLEPGCVAARGGDPERFPPPRRRPRVQRQHWVATILHGPRGVWLTPIPAEAELLPGHWGLPLRRCPRSTSPSEAAAIALAREAAREGFGLTPRSGELLPEVRHGITFRRLHVHPVWFRIPRAPANRRARKLLRRGEEDRLPALFRKILRSASR